MSLKTTITKELMFTYFAGKANALQKQRIENWIEKPENEEFFYECINEWERQNPTYVADVNAGLRRFRNNISESAGSSKRIVNKEEQVRKGFNNYPPAAPASKRRPALIIAASVVLLLGLSTWLFGDFIFYKTYQTGYGEISTIKLPDGSKATLNADSKLKINRFGFGGLSRQVTLNGEANFEVVHTPDHQKFVVLTGPFLKVEVLGTEFNVFARKRATKVGLYKGKVKVIYGPSTEQVRAFNMVPGDLITLHKNGGTLVAKKVCHPENFSAWRHGRFIFENTSLKEIGNILQENYGLEVELNGLGLAEQTVSGSFKAYSVNELLQAFAETLDIEVSYQGNKVVFIERNNN